MALQQHNFAPASIPAARQHNPRSSLVRPIASSSFRREASRTFETIDLNRDGKISAHELATLLARLEKAATGSKHGLCGSGSLLGAGGDLIGFAEEVIREADVDGDGMIDFEEFLLSARAGPSLLGEYFVSVPPSDEEEESVSDGGSDSEKDDMEGDLFRAFEVFDRDSNGVITAEELQFVIGVLNGDNLTMEDCKRMIKRVDTNGDGCVDYSEFRTMMAGIFD